MGQTAVVISKQIGHTYVTKYLFCNSLPLPAQCYLLLLCNMYVKFKLLFLYNSKGDELKT